MLGVYLFILASVIALAIAYNALHIKAIRIFGCELAQVLIWILGLTLFIGEVLVPMPTYYIKHQGISTRSYTDASKPYSLNQIVEEEALKSGLHYDAGSFKIIDSCGMSVNHLFLCAYQADGKEAASVLHFEKNIFGDMRPKFPLKNAYVFTKDSGEDGFYRAYVKDGILGDYLVTAGYAGAQTVLKNVQLNDFRMEELHPSGYFMWVELVREPWKTSLALLILNMIVIFVVRKMRSRNRPPVRFYQTWRRGDKIVSIIKDEEQE